jgi:hypothetical protein
VKEAGANPENAAAAARAARELLSAATALQSRTRISVQQNYFLPEDERREGEASGEEGGDEDVISQDEDGDDEGEEQSGNEGVDSEADAQTASGSGSDKEEEEGGGSESGDDSDGYGDDGLSWEAVLAAVQPVSFGSRIMVGLGCHPAVCFPFRVMMSICNPDHEGEQVLAHEPWLLLPADTWRRRCTRSARCAVLCWHITNLPPACALLAALRCAGPLCTIQV